MKKSTKRISAMILAAFMLLSVAGCTSGGDNKDNSSQSAGNDNKGGSSGNELRFTSWANTGEIKVLSRAIDAYNEKQSNVKIVFESSASDTYEQKLITALSGGTAWDAFYAGDATISKLIQNGSIEKLNDFMATEDSFCKVEDFADGLWGAARTDDGSIYGLPVDCNPTLLYYQPKMMEEIGANNPQDLWDADNWNWDTFDEILSKGLAADKQGFLFSGDNLSVYRFVSGAGGTIWQKDAEGNDLYQFDEKAKEGLQYCADRLADGRFTYSGLLPEGQGEDAQFISGLCVFSQAGRWNTPSFVEAGVDHDYIPYPSKDGTKFPPSQIATAYAAVNKNSKLKDEALKFITYYCSKDGQTDRLKDSDGKPGNAVPSINGLENLVTEGGIPEHASYLLEVRDNGWALGSDFARDSIYPSLDTEIRTIFEEIWVNGKSVDEILPKVEEKANEMIKEFNAQ